MIGSGSIAGDQTLIIDSGPQFRQAAKARLAAILGAASRDFRGQSVGQFVICFSLLCIAIVATGCKEQSTATTQPTTRTAPISKHDEGELIDDTWSVNFLR